jgi:hypothetical protein
VAFGLLGVGVAAALMSVARWGLNVNLPRPMQIIIRYAYDVFWPTSSVCPNDGIERNYFQLYWILAFSFLLNGLVYAAAGCILRVAVHLARRRAQGPCPEK